MFKKILENRVGFLVSLFTLLGMIGGFYFWLGSTKWADKEHNEEAHQVLLISKEKFEGKINTIDERTRLMQKQQDKFDRKLDRIFEKVK